MKKERVIMARLVERDKADRSFDVEFWRKVGAQGRFEAAWQMVLEAEAFKGNTAENLRMDSSVQNIVGEIQNNRKEHREEIIDLVYPLTNSIIKALCNL